MENDMTRERLLGSRSRLEWENIKILKETNFRERSIRGKSSEISKMTNLHKVHVDFLIMMVMLEKLCDS